MASLSKYRQKRKFYSTPEPEGKIKKSKEPIFVVQEHHATRLHYDFRLEHNGVLKSWAVPKGISMDPSDKRLAVETEDHPLDYADFAGTIPKGNYGAGKVFIWDKGTFENMSGKEDEPLSFDGGYKKGHLKVKLNGTKLHGEFHLLRTSNQKQWLLFRKKEENKIKSLPEKVSGEGGIGEVWKIKKSASKKSDETIKVGNHEFSLSNPDKILFPQSQITKKELVEYYEFIADYMLPHVKDRPISMNRFPSGIKSEFFFQKETPGYFPDWIKTKAIKHEEGITNYAICNDKESLVYLGSQVVVPHIWLSRIDKLRYPDKMIFDLDPQKGEFDFVIDGARIIKDIFDDFGIESLVMSTGSRGLHIVVPLDRSLEFHKVSSFAKVIARLLERHDAKKFTAQQRKEKREGKVFIDTYRNAFSQTAVAPYAVRAIEYAPIAVPLEWREVNAKLNPQEWTIRNIRERIDKKGDIWEDIYKKGQSLGKALEKIK